MAQKVNKATLAAIQCMDVTAPKLITIEAKNDASIDVNFVGVNALDAAAMIGASIARAYSTFPEESKQTISLGVFAENIIKYAGKYHHQLNGIKDE